LALFDGTDGMAAASGTTVGALFAQQARIVPERIALEDCRRRWTYAQLDERVRRLAQVLHGLDIARGDRLGLLSENRAEFIEVVLAAARIGAIVAGLNWRLSAPELDACLALTQPKLIVHSGRHALPPLAAALPAIAFGPDYEARMAAAPPHAPPPAARVEDGLLIQFTSGSTGTPKGALISHRALIWRGLLYRAEVGLETDRWFPAWTPMFHMGATDPVLAMLLGGGQVFAVDGFDLDRLLALVRERPINWLVLVPGVVDRFIDGARAARLVPNGVRLCGVMPDLVPRHQIEEVMDILGAPFFNSFGSTETGLPPASGGVIAPGRVPQRLPKRQSSLCEIRLVDSADRDVADGQPGELLVRGPTLFSGYWNAQQVNSHEFRGGWFHMGDVFTRNPDGTLEFVDRVKYLIKSGGENIYPAEIEQVLRTDPGVGDVVVVRQPDARWGEVPVAVVVPTRSTLDEAGLLRLCDERLARYKRPKRIVFTGQLPRNISGKVVRADVESWLAGQP
jgi:fatty-acyl-CoA synthase